MWLSSLIFSPECFRLDSYIKIFTNNLKTENSLKTGGINAWYFLNVSFQIISQCSCKLLRKPIIDALFCCLFYFYFVFRNTWVLSYFMISVHCSHYFFWCSRYLSCQLQWLLIPLSLMDFLLLGAMGFFRFILYFHALDSESGICPRSPGSFHWNLETTVWALEMLLLLGLFRAQS